MNENTGRQPADKKEYTHATAYYAGSWSTVGAAIGAIFGLMRFEKLTFGYANGAAVDLVTGAVIDAQRPHKTVRSRSRE
jgi:hypothetical protein